MDFDRIARFAYSTQISKNYDLKPFPCLKTCLVPKLRNLCNFGTRSPTIDDRNLKIKWRRRLQLREAKTVWL